MEVFGGSQASLGRSAHPTVAQTHGLGGAFTVQSGRRGLLLSLGTLPSLFPGWSAVGGGDVEEISLWLWSVGVSSIPQACGFSCKLPPPSCLHLPSTRPGPKQRGLWRMCPGLSIFICRGWGSLGKPGCKDEDFGVWRASPRVAADPAHSFPAHTPTTPSTTNETAVPVPATPGCRPCQHPLTCLQPFPVSNIRASHDSHPWPTHHVCTASRWVVGHEPQPSPVWSPWLPPPGHRWCVLGSVSLKKMSDRASPMCSRGRWPD